MNSSTAQNPPGDAPLPPYDPWPPSRLASTEVKLDQNSSSAMDLDNSTERSSRAQSAFSVDDYEVARALTSLQEGSPSIANLNAPKQRHEAHTLPLNDEQAPQPLLKLFTSQHPRVANAITNSLSAYSNSKSYSPSFKASAEFLERNIATPMANTVGTASRISGVETGVRWWLQRNDFNSNIIDESNNTNNNAHAPLSAKGDFPPPPQGSKRRRDSITPTPSSPYTSSIPPPSTRPRTLSELSQPESLPPYDDRRSPAYEEIPGPPSSSHTHTHSQSSTQSGNLPPTPQSWPTRVAIHTSGLGVAMSDESLRSLKYCLTWLRWANGHLATVLGSLQAVLEEWERAQKNESAASSSYGETEDSSMMEGVISTDGTSIATTETMTEGSSARHRQPTTRDQATIANHLQALKNECVKTLKTALDVVSKYAGGALPENARWLVRCHLTSLPQRFRLAAGTAGGSRNGSISSEMGGVVQSERGGGAIGDEEAQKQHQQLPEAVTGAQRVVVLAREGLDMMAQVSAVVDGTIVSAEDWLEKLGRRRGNGAGEAGEEETEAGEERMSFGEDGGQRGGMGVGVGLHEAGNRNGNVSVSVSMGSEEKTDVEKLAREVLGAMPVHREGDTRRGDAEMGEKREKM